MPDARIEPDGVLRLGLSRFPPYSSGYATLSVFPWLEVSGEVTRVDDVLAFRRPDRFHPEYGNYKDKAFDFKAVLLKETNRLPSVAVGMQDFLGTELFRTYYMVASKKVGDLDFTLGYGKERIDGVFGGVRYSPRFLKNWALVAEYDAYDYAHDKHADLTGTNQRKKGSALGIEYTRGPFTMQVSHGHGEFGANAYFKIPLNVTEYVPKVQEPPPYTKVRPRPSLQQWNLEPVHKRGLVEALQQQNFRNIHFYYDNGRFLVSLTNSRISSPPRAVGRAARTILAFAPIETREIEITYTVRDMPLVTYDFFDAEMLQRYFNGMASRKMLASRVEILYPERREAQRNDDLAMASEEMLSAFDEAVEENGIRYGHEGDLISFHNEDANANRFSIKPGLSFYLNDPSGAFRYAVNAVAAYDRKLGEGVFLQSTGQFSVFEDVSKVSNPSNSELPHVRSDVAEYFRDTKARLDSLLVNKFFLLDERLYGRASVGLYEMMFGGVGGQLLYIPRSEPWALDFSLDALRQRDTKGLFGFRDYSTVTALAALHYRLPEGFTGTVRAGRFLAKDLGARFELKRRFQSGIEFGVWYTYTDGDDITDPGRPDSPYYDKGIFLTLPFNSLLPYDTQASGSFSLAPWTRDVGQMVKSPADLYEMVERPLFRHVYSHDGLSQLGDVSDDYHLPSLGTSLFDRPLWTIAKNDLSGTASAIASTDTLKNVGIGLGLILASSGFDKRADRFAEQHGDNRNWRNFARVGDALPVAGIAGAALFSLGGGSDTRLSATALAAVEAAGVGAVANWGLKYAIGRSRPDAGFGNSDFHPGGKGDSDQSFPSLRTTMAWAVATPFAKEYDAPWLYGVAALTNVARVINRKHWVSDTVAGSLLGYGLGSLYWNLRLKDWENGLQLHIGPNSVHVTVPIK